MDTRKTGLVLGGGGSRGAYEIGVWQALRELGLSIEIVTGTSVGAINGAMIVQGSFDLAVSLWKEIDTAMVFDVDIENMIQPVNLANLDISNIKKPLRLGNTRLKSMLDKYIDEDAIRNSPINFGLVTVELSSMTPKHLMKSQIPKGKMVDYILASSTLFPASKSYEIDSVKYVDGGYADNLPVGLALDNGATHTVAVDLEAVGIINKKRIGSAENLKLIQCFWDLGNFMIFDKNNSKRILRLGYLDTLKAFDVYEGSYFSFVKGDFDKRHIRGADMAGRIFELDPELIYKKFVFDDLLKEAIASNLSKIEKDLQSLLNPFQGKLLDNLVKAKSSLSQKSLTLFIAHSLKNQPDIRNIFLSKPAIKMLKDEISVANYIVREGLF